MVSLRDFRNLYIAGALVASSVPGALVGGTIGAFGTTHEGGLMTRLAGGAYDVAILNEVGQQYVKGDEELSDIVFDRLGAEEVFTFRGLEFKIPQIGNYVIPEFDFSAFDYIPRLDEPLPLEDTFETVADIRETYNWLVDGIKSVEGYVNNLISDTNSFLDTNRKRIDAANAELDSYKAGLDEMQRTAVAGYKLGELIDGRRDVLSTNIDQNRVMGTIAVPAVTGAVMSSLAGSVPLVLPVLLAGAVRFKEDELVIGEE